MIDIGDYTEANPGGGETLRGHMYFKWREEETNSNITPFGVHHWCNNKYGEEVICFRSTGGILPDGSTCGTSLDPANNSFAEQLALANDPANQCNPGNKHMGSGHRFWLNGWIRDSYVIDRFAPPYATVDANTIPVNRFCFEFEIDDNQDYRTSNSGADILANPALSTLVNQDDVPDPLKSITISYGTYTSPRGNAAGETDGDVETGGTYHGGGTHYYHSNTKYDRYPLDGIYAIDHDTFVSCMTNHPSGVRTGMRPTFGHNPMSTVVGETNNVTDAYSYLSYLTRFYVDFPSSNTVQYPNDTKINKFWFMYEPDDIMILNANNGIRSMELINQGETAQYLVTLRNKANESRSYRLFMSAGDNQQMVAASDTFRVYIDSNTNGVLDAGTDIELTPNSITTLTASQELDLILTHTPDFTNQDETTDRSHGGYWGATAGLVFKEVGRLRSASFSLRTWQANSPADITNKVAVLQSLDSPIAESGAEGSYDRLSEFNHERNDRPWFVRDFPDYIEFTAP